jgi:hypothetical protein
MINRREIIKKSAAALAIGSIGLPALAEKEPNIIPESEIREHILRCQKGCNYAFMLQVFLEQLHGVKIMPLHRDISEQGARIHALSDDGRKFQQLAAHGDPMEFGSVHVRKLAEKIAEKGNVIQFAKLLIPSHGWISPIYGDAWHNIEDAVSLRGLIVWNENRHHDMRLDALFTAWS